MIIHHNDTIAIVGLISIFDENGGDYNRTMGCIYRKLCENDFPVEYWDYKRLFRL